MKNKIKEILGRTYRVPGVNLIESTIKSFSLAEKVIFGFFSFILIFSALGLIYKLSTALSVEVPSYGGEITEGVVGFPRFVNPLLAISDADKDLTNVIYSGLTKTGSNGEIINDLAESHEISEDGKTYTFKIKNGAEFHDGTKVTSEDVVFTIKSAQNELLKSPKRPNWLGVDVEAPDEHTVIFTLKQPYAPFLENTNLGILPKHIWQNLDAEQFPFSQFNIEPIGTGPYKVSKIKRNSAGVANYYELKSFRKYALGKPYINTVMFKFFTNEEELITAYNKKNVENINSISPSKAKELDQQGKKILRVPLSRIFGLFLNQNQKPILAGKEVRTALNLSLDKSRVVNEALYGYGSTINGPIPPGILPDEIAKTSYSPLDAKSVLENGGWKWNESESAWQKKVGKSTENLSFEITTADAPELKKTAEIMKENWESIGIKINIKIFETGTLNQTIIRPRKYDSLLFGEIIGRDMDLFAFWHSSQRNDPGLNVSQYASLKTDKLLEESRTISDKDARLAKFQEFQNEISKDMPAIFTYSPDFLYIISDKLKGFDMKSISIPSERFNNINNWYIDTERVWTLINKINESTH